MLLSAFVNGATSFGSNLVLVRFIEPEGFGRFALVLSAVGVVHAVLSLRLGILAIRLPEREYTAERRELLLNAFAQECLILLAPAIVWLVVAGYWSVWSVVLLAAMTLGLFERGARALYERGMPYGNLALLETGTHLFGHTLAIAVAVGGGGASALYLRAASIALLSIVWLRALGGLPGFRLRLVSLREWRALWREARGIWADQARAGIFQPALILLAERVGGERGAGIFYQALRLAGVPHQFLSPVVSRLAYNWFSRARDERERIVTRRKLMAVIAVPLGIAALVNALTAHWFVPVVFGEQWSAVVPVLVALSGFILFTSLHAIVRVALMSAARTRALLTSGTLQFVGLVIPLVPLLAGRPVDPALLGLGVSVGFFLAFAWGWGALEFGGAGAEPRGGAERS